MAAEDVAHEALLRAWVSRDTCRKPEDPWPWLKQIVHNEAMRYLGAQPPADALPPEIDGCEADARIDGVLDRSALHSLLGSLSPADRALLRMHYELDLSVASLAAALEIDESAVKVRLHRARGRLRANLQRSRANWC
jgi:RNA polymerase sigma-70 factor, ECF subfamily